MNNLFNKTSIEPELIATTLVGPFDLPGGGVQNRWNIFRQVLPREVKMQGYGERLAWAYCNNNAPQHVQEFAQLSTGKGERPYLFICIDLYVLTANH
jgi:hypothetical protein